MIRLEIDLSYLAKHFEIGTQRLNQYGSKSIDEIMEDNLPKNSTADELDYNLEQLVRLILIIYIIPKLLIYGINTATKSITTVMHTIAIT